jgi:hypothetical protein
MRTRSLPAGPCLPPKGAVTTSTAYVEMALAAASNTLVGSARLVRTWRRGAVSSSRATRRPRGASTRPGSAAATGGRRAERLKSADQEQPAPDGSGDTEHEFQKDIQKDESVRSPSLGKGSRVRYMTAFAGEELTSQMSTAAHVAPPANQGYGGHRSRSRGQPDALHRSRNA